METVRLYTSSAWNRLAEKLNIDPQRRVCTFRLRVLLTTLTVCGMLFGAAGFAVLGRGGGNAMHRGSFLSQPKVIDGAELQEMMVKNGSAKTEKAPTKREEDISSTTTAFTDSITDDDDDGGGFTDDEVTEDFTEEMITTTATPQKITTIITTAKSSNHFGPLSVDNKRDSRNNQPQPKAVTTKDLLNALGKNSHGGGVTPCPPGKQLVKQVVTEEIASDGLSGGSLLSYSSRLICKGKHGIFVGATLCTIFLTVSISFPLVPKGLPWFMKGSTTARPKNAPKIKTTAADAQRNAKKPHPKILKKTTTTTKRPANSRSTPFRGRPKTRGLVPPHHKATTKHPKGKVVHPPHRQQVHVGSRKATTPTRRRPPSPLRTRIITTKRPKWKVTFPPRIFRHPSTPKLPPFSVREWKQLEAKMLARWCARICVTNPAAGGHACHCDDPPMEVEQGVTRRTGVVTGVMRW